MDTRIFSLRLRLLIAFGICALALDAQVATSYDDFLSKDRFEKTRLSTHQAEAYFEGAATHFKQQKDTSNYLIAQSYLVDISYRRGHYNEAFETLHRVLPLARQHHDAYPLVELNQNLVVLYQAYNKDSLALNLALENVQVIHQLLEKDQVMYKGKRTSCYLAVAVQALQMNQLSLAEAYLDSCYLTHPKHERLYFVDAFRASYYCKMGEYDRALQVLDGTVEYMEKNNSNFLTMVYKIYGEIFEAKKDITKVIYYYGEAVMAIDSHENNLVSKPEILERLSRFYFIRGWYHKAYESMSQAKMLTDSLFSLQSQQNQALFDIKNHYYQQVSQHEVQLAQQAQEINEARQTRFFLLTLVSALLFILVAIAIFYQMKSRLRRAEQARLALEEETQAEIEKKNKELTANALQFVEKDQTIKEFIDFVSAEVPSLREKLQQRYQLNTSSKVWDDFNMRFVQTHERFYELLLEKHPQLTPTDLKLCALLRLQFDSKEMSQFLGISTSSVHMSRSRLRKKLGLAREESLTSYLAQIG